MNKKEEIFTIGDKTTLGIITCFRLLDNKIMVDFDNKNSILLRSKQLQHIKQPLFTTEDGVDIFKNIDKYYTPIYIVDKALNIRYCEKDFNVKHSENVKYFSIKEKAEEYILMNKPCLSLNDIFKDVEEMRKGLKTFENSQLAKRFKKLVQQKLNN
jgi:hypothetical protein